MRNTVPQEQSMMQNTWLPHRAQFASAAKAEPERVNAVRRFANVCYSTVISSKPR